MKKDKKIQVVTWGMLFTFFTLQSVFTFASEPVLVCSRYDSLWKYSIEITPAGETYKVSMRNYPSFRGSFTKEFEDVQKGGDGRFFNSTFELTPIRAEVPGFFDLQLAKKTLGGPEGFHDVTLYCHPPLGVIKRVCEGFVEETLAHIYLNLYEKNGAINGSVSIVPPSWKNTAKAVGAVYRNLKPNAIGEIEFQSETKDYFRMFWSPEYRSREQYPRGTGDWSDEQRFYDLSATISGTYAFAENGQCMNITNPTPGPYEPRRHSWQ